MANNRTDCNTAFLSRLGDAIRNRRINLYLSQEQLGAKSKLSRTYITSVENGLRNISMITLLKIAKALKNRASVQILEAEKAQPEPI